MASTQNLSSPHDLDLVRAITCNAPRAMSLRQMTELYTAICKTTGWRHQSGFDFAAFCALARKCMYNSLETGSNRDIALFPFMAFVNHGCGG